MMPCTPVAIKRAAAPLGDPLILRKPAGGAALLRRAGQNASRTCPVMPTRKTRSTPSTTAAFMPKVMAPFTT